MLSARRNIMAAKFGASVSSIEISNSSQAVVAGSSSLSLSVPSGVELGDLLVAVMCCGDDRDWGTHASFSLRAINTSNYPGLCVQTRVASASEPGSYSFTASGSSDLVGFMILIKGGVWDTAGSVVFTDNDSNDVVAESIVVASAGSLLLAPVATRFGDFASTEGMELLLSEVDGNRPNLQIFYEEGLDAGASGTRTFEPSAASRKDAVLLAISPI
ncbi:MAG: hypothetical protein R3332_08280 [Pseudohongiellaceae bacterium]|nr:hypothetical protein [Pseudohongiellaceae bacterium]